MRTSLVAIIASASTFAAAVPTSNQEKINAGLRLIKTSETDPGRWVTDDEKIIDYVAKGKKFIDVTDVTDNDILQRLSMKPEELSVQVSSVNRISYPSNISHQAQAMPLLSKINTSGPKAWLKTMSDMFNRYYKSDKGGPESATWMFNMAKQVAAANPAIKVAQFKHAFNQPSVIVTIPGAPETVIAGAHFDSTGGNPTARGPGADDNGSGTVVLLESLRVLAEAKFKPKNTLEFHFYAGEEGGLMGSAPIFASYKQQNRKVIAMMNQDQAGMSPSKKICVFEDYADEGLKAFVKKVVMAYGGGSFTTDKCGYGCSDHVSAMNNGFPATYVADEPIKTASKFVHSPKDTYETVEWDAIMRHAKYTTGFMVEASFI